MADNHPLKLYLKLITATSNLKNRGHRWFLKTFDEIANSFNHVNDFFFFIEVTSCRGNPFQTNSMWNLKSFISRSGVINWYIHRVPWKTLLHGSHNIENFIQVNFTNQLVKIVILHSIYEYITTFELIFHLKNDTVYPIQVFDNISHFVFLKISIKNTPIVYVLDQNTQRTTYLKVFHC